MIAKSFNNHAVVVTDEDNHAVVFISGGTNSLAIINQFWVVEPSNRLNMSTPRHRGFCSSCHYAYQL